MQVDRGFLQVAMTQKHLDSAQVGTSFQQVGSETVTQSMRMDVLVFKTSALRSALTGCPKNLGGDGIACRVPSVAGK
jgi:hypothetical protein